nr:MAG TPA: hypothetical protein [Caudoviricetes sp.]
MTRFNYAIVTPKRTTVCRDMNAALYLYSCRKTASIVRHDRQTGNDSIVASKTCGIESFNFINS